MSARGRPRKFDEEAALASLLEVFRLKGFHGASLDDLTHATNMNRPSLYGAFGNKQDLFVASVEYYWADAGKRFRDALFGMKGLDADLHNLFETQIDIITKSEVGGCIVACSLPEAVDESPAFKTLYDRIFTESDKVVASRLFKAIEGGEIAKGTDVRRLSGLIVNEVFGISLRARAGFSKQELTRQAFYVVDLITKEFATKSFS
ncbi:TetR/AcrR family transcriptional regulator [Sneathiella glossodoripedis]|uniref:TetR/AcrR family transcriptional regulator n=1 Tax=Sneathiella glossodoripedis TaxID=418853 RepID=UPI0004718A80|nr:TetR/AcrR family transcriptional regulator [Sneathiella glossodoripedis]